MFSKSKSYLTLSMGLALIACQTGPEGPPRRCVSDIDCTGSRVPACNLVTKRCVECTASNLSGCDDGNPCTTASCGATYLCRQIPAATGTLCSKEPLTRCNPEGECVASCQRHRDCNENRDIDCMDDVCLNMEGIKLCASRPAAAYTPCDDDEGEVCNDQGACITSCESTQECTEFEHDVCREDVCKEIDGVEQCSWEITGFEEACDLSGEFGTGGGICNDKGQCVECMDVSTLCVDEEGPFCRCTDPARPLCDEVEQSCVECLSNLDCGNGFWCCANVCVQAQDVINPGIDVPGCPSPGGGCTGDDCPTPTPDEGATEVRLECQVGKIDPMTGLGSVGRFFMRVLVEAIATMPVIHGQRITIDFDAQRLEVERTPSDPINDAANQDADIVAPIAKGKVIAGGGGSATIELDPRRVTLPEKGAEFVVEDVGQASASVIVSDDPSEATLKILITEAGFDLHVLDGEGGFTNFPVACVNTPDTATLDFPIEGP